MANPIERPSEGVMASIKINGQTASKRTRNRVREAGPDFFIEKETFSQRFNTKCILVRSPKGFFGWLPLNEIIVTTKKGESNFD